MTRHSRVAPRLAAATLATACALTIFGAASPTSASESGYTIDEVRDLMGQSAEIHRISRTASGIEISGRALALGFTGNPIEVGVTVDGVKTPRLPTSRIVPRSNPEGLFDIAVDATPGTHTVCIVGHREKPLECKTITKDNEVGQLREVTWASVNSETNEIRTLVGTDTSNFYRPGEDPSLRLRGSLVDAEGNHRGEDIRVTVNGATVQPDLDPPFDPEPGQAQSDAFSATVRAANTVDNDVCVYARATNNLIACKRLVSTPETTLRQ